jgi:putative glutamine amidotransferase
MRPLIGITASTREKEGSISHELNDRYVQAIWRAGGLPILLPVGEPETAMTLAQQLDGVVFSGGRDIPPDLYGEPLHPATMTDDAMRRRAEFEIALAKAMAELGKPMLGICLGCQLLNVAFGGTLLQDIPSEHPNALQHRNERGFATHPVCVERPSLLANWLNLDSDSEIVVASSHHQAIKRVGEGLRIVAYAPDGIVEAVEAADGKPVIGVQWHPEAQQEATHAQRLFESFVRACVRE